MKRRKGGGISSEIETRANSQRVGKDVFSRKGGGISSEIETEIDHSDSPVKGKRRKGGGISSEIETHRSCGSTSTLAPSQGRWDLI